MKMIFETHGHYDDEQFDTDREQLLEEFQRQDIRYVMHRHLFGSEQGGADNLQHLILRSLRINVSGKAVSAFYYK